MIFLTLKTDLLNPFKIVLTFLRQKNEVTLHSLLIKS
jgi:hypothetical protein